MAYEQILTKVVMGKDIITSATVGALSAGSTISADETIQSIIERMVCTPPIGIIYGGGATTNWTDNWNTSYGDQAYSSNCTYSSQTTKVKYPIGTATNQYIGILYKSYGSTAGIGYSTNNAGSIGTSITSLSDASTITKQVIQCTTDISDFYLVVQCGASGWEEGRSFSANTNYIRMTLASRWFEIYGIVVSTTEQQCDDLLDQIITENGLEV